MESLVKRININNLVDIERFELQEAKIMVYHAIIEKIESMVSDYELVPEQVETLREKYTAKLSEATLQMQIFLSQHAEPDKLLKTALSLHALGIESDHLHEMFAYNEIPEKMYFERKAKIDKQVSRIQ